MAPLHIVHSILTYRILNDTDLGLHLGILLPVGLLPLPVLDVLLSASAPPPQLLLLALGAERLLATLLL